MPDQVFTLPIYFDYGATFLWAISGALIGARRGYDRSGVLVLALVSSTGGGLIRDGFFLQNGPPALVRTPIYLILIAAATTLVFFVGARIQKFRQFSRIVRMVDALGLGAYAVVGMQLSIEAGLSLPAIVLVGLVNAVGGGVLRDVLIRKEPDLFLPGTFTALAALASCIVFLSLEKGFGIAPNIAAWPTIAVAFTIYVISVRYNLQTRSLPGFEASDSE